MTRDEAKKLKKGDLVLCLKSSPYPSDPAFTKGKIYEIGGEYYMYKNELYQNDISIKSDNQGQSNGWNREYFSPVTSEETIELYRLLFGEI